MKRSAVATGLAAALLSAASAPAGEDEAVAFARENLPEMADMMERLRDRSPAEFQRAVRDVERARTRIERLPEDSPRRADELARWTLRSGVQMASARLAAVRSKPKPPAAAVAKLEAALDDLAGQWIALERSRLAREEEALAKRLEDVRRQAAEIEADPKAAAAKTAERYRKAAEAAARRAAAKRKKPKTGGPAKSSAGAP